MPLTTIDTRVAVFRYIEHNFECVYSESMDEATDLIRVSDYIDVTFVPRAEEEIIPAIVASLDKEANKILEEALQKLNKIAERRAEILQITFMPKETL